MGRLIDKGGRYLWEDVANPRNVEKYRRRRVNGHVLTIAVLKNGKTVVTSIGHPREEKNKRHRRPR